MPSKSGKPRKADLPSTLQRSDAKAQDTYAETLAAAEAEYGDEGRAHRTAFASLKRTHEKVGDHWAPKADGAHGPSDGRAEKGGLNKLPGAGGVDANASKSHLLDLARQLDVRGRSRMTKPELVEALMNGQQPRDREVAPPVAPDSRGQATCFQTAATVEVDDFLQNHSRAEASTKKSPTLPVGGWLAAELGTIRTEAAPPVN